MKEDEPQGHITVIRRERSVEGFKYRVDISFSGKPDYSKVRREATKNLGQTREIDDWTDDPKIIWEYILLEALYPELAELYKAIEPVTDKITDIVLVASSRVLGIEWYRVKLFVLSDDALDVDEFKFELDSSLDKYFRPSSSKRVRFLEVTKIPKFPKEGRLISKTDIPITMKMITDAGDHIERKREAAKKPSYDAEDVMAEGY